MTHQPTAASSTESLGQQLGSGRAGALCACGCGRHASRRSGYRWYHGHDPAVPQEEKTAALQLGGRRGQMTPAEVVTLLEGADLDTREGRQQLRDRFLRLRLAGRLGTAAFNDVLKVVDGAARDQARENKLEPPPQIVVVTGQGSDNAHEAGT